MSIYQAPKEARCNDCQRKFRQLFGANMDDSLILAAIEREGWVTQERPPYANGTMRFTFCPTCVAAEKDKP
jgi:hypothetical protein